KARTWETPRSARACWPSPYCFTMASTSGAAVGFAGVALAGGEAAAALGDGAVMAVPLAGAAAGAGGVDVAHPRSAQSTPGQGTRRGIFILRCGGKCRRAGPYRLGPGRHTKEQPPSSGNCPGTAPPSPHEPAHSLQAAMPHPVQRSEAGRRLLGCNIFRELPLLRGLLLLVALLGPRTSDAAQAAIRAMRTPEPPKLDGRGDDPVWQRAPPFTDFLEQYPNEGAHPAAGWGTEVRVLYDNRTLFILVVCHDPDPSRIQRQLERRDSVLVGDLIEVSLDSPHDRRSGYYFGVNAAGVLRDGLLFGDVNLADTWDGVWDAAVASLPDGWSAELAIPLDLLRFPRAQSQDWGIL